MLLVAVLALMIAAFTVAAPSDRQRLASKRQDTDRVPSCPADNSMIFRVDDNGMPVPGIPERAACNCSYEGSRAGQVGSVYDFDWYQGRTCNSTSFAELILSQTERKAWEIRCQCSPVPASETRCITSDLEGQWMRCLIFTGTWDAATSDTYCSSISYPDGRTEKAITWCSIAGDYYWG